jgi:hypothetical protein
VLIAPQHVAQDNADEDDDQDKSYENPICGAESEHYRLLLNASAASFVMPISW